MDFRHRNILFRTGVAALVSGCGHDLDDCFEILAGVGMGVKSNDEKSRKED
jgi:hypothetical protein